MRIIYEPSGKAGEYAGLAANPYQSCSHGCKYCYVPPILKRDRQTYYEELQLKKNWLKDMHKDAAKLGKDRDMREILLSFVGDVYQPAEAELGTTRRCLEILIGNGLRFTILTKGGMRAARDFDLLHGYAGATFGTTLVFTEQTDADEWEPGAASISDRIQAIGQAYSMGIPTWVSLEPVIYPAQALELVERLHPVVRHWKIGKLNYIQPPAPVDWLAFRQDISLLCDRLGADYYIKKSLADLARDAA